MRCRPGLPLVVTLAAACLSLTAQGQAAETFTLAPPASAGALTRVTAQLEVGGNLKVTGDGQVKNLPMSVVAQIVYDELILVAEGEHTSSLRHYDRAEATIKIQKGGAKPKLRDTRRLIGADWNSAGVTLFSPEGPLTREELDLITLPANTLLINALLPTEPVSLHSSWKPSGPLLASLLDLDAVAQSDVRCILTNVTAGRNATVEMSGKLEGAARGVTSKVELKGRYTYDFTAGRITWLVLLANEDRSIGHVATGLDVTSKITLTVSPLQESKHLTADAVQRVEFIADLQQNPLVYESSTAGLRLHMDRRWHKVLDEPKLLTLRFVDRGDLLAQCNVAPLEKAEPGKHVSLEKFQADIREALGNNFGQFMRATQGTDDQGRTLYRVIATGKVSELLIEWRYYLVADDQGRQVAMAFTLEQDLVERFGDLDRHLVGSVEFFEPSAETARAPEYFRRTK